MSNTIPRERKLLGVSIIKIHSYAWNVRRIALDQVFIPENYRPCQEEYVRALAESMNAPIGLRTPITVWKSDGQAEGVSRGTLVLLAGRHRLEAAKSLNWTHIESIELKGTEQQARLWHVEENLIRGDLSVLDRAEHIDQWVLLHEANNEISGQPDQKKKPGRPEGGIAKAARNLPVPGKTEEARRKFIERSIKIATIAPEAKAAVRSAGLANNQRALLAIANEPTPEAQLLKVAELSAAKRARPKQDSSAPVSGIGGEAPVPGSPASTPVDSLNTRTEPHGDDLGSAPVGGIDGEAHVPGSPASAPAVSPNIGTKPDGDGLMAGWQNAEAFRRAWGKAPVAVREKFYAEVMQHYRE
jgi:hypothetical protein